MKIKLDENLGVRLKAVFEEAGHDVLPVAAQGLSGKADEVIYHVCRNEGRVLVTLDQDFTNILRFPPEPASGIAVIEVPEPATHATLVQLGRALTAALKERDIVGKLWIVQPGRIRERPAWSEEP